eukprot:CAMPEP_0181379696 /NCGR_PEP_ID=MMETSP1106-20121128/19136_1 /TAXON_ID=81844 /ORGANISM="Mantoniella antarctica, Strain SL-175" /LENGTH=203 /DNA_ID=CAMNT_0023498651 /DNA_START=683 /DNA_END=1292 /DNA_ORIENTATION=+
MASSIERRASFQLAYTGGERAVELRTWNVEDHSSHPDSESSWLLTPSSSDRRPSRDSRRPSSTSPCRAKLPANAATSCRAEAASDASEPPRPQPPSHCKPPTPLKPTPPAVSADEACRRIASTQKRAGSGTGARSRRHCGGAMVTWRVGSGAGGGSTAAVSLPVVHPPPAAAAADSLPIVHPPPAAAAADSLPIVHPPPAAAA